MPNRRYNEDRQRSNEPYNARSEYGRRRRSSNGPSEYDRGEDYYEGGRSRYGTPPSGSFSGGDFERGYGSERGNYPETYGGHGSYEGVYNRPQNYGDRTDPENEYQNRNRNFENPDRNVNQSREMYRGGGDSGYGRNYRDRSARDAGLFGGNTDRSRYPESERGYHEEDDRGWWDKAADEVSSWMGDEEASRRREVDHLRHGQYRGHGPRNYKRSDERIKEDINDRLTDHSNLDASDVDVEVNACEVVLTGTVASRYAKRMAEDIADNVSGVRNVENRLRVENKPSWISGVGDINTAGSRSKFQDISDPEPETKSMSKNA